MHERILARELGALSPRDFAKTLTTELIGGFDLAQHHRFDGVSAAAVGGSSASQSGDVPIVAHNGGANTVAIEKFDGKL